MSRDKRAFVKALAQFLVGDQAKKSIMLEMPPERTSGAALAREWAALRATTPLFGYPTLEEAEKKLADWLS